MRKISARQLALGALIAALYAVLTYFSAAFSLAYTSVQFRISEVLTILPVFTPAAIPGLTLGCLISNIGSFNPIDMLVGTVATFLAAILTRSLRNIKWFKLPLLSFLPPVILNALFVGLEISIFYLDGFTVWGFVISAVQVGLGELAVCYALGIPFYLSLKNHAERLFNQSFK